MTPHALLASSTHDTTSQVRPTDLLLSPAPNTTGTTDPRSNAAAKLRREWRVLSGTRIAVQDQNTVRPADAREIRRGDFVEVLATVVIEERWQYNTKDVLGPPIISSELICWKVPNPGLFQEEFPTSGQRVRLFRRFK